MQKYPESLISEICSENDIIDYVSRYVSLKKSGRDFSGLCPFHNEKSPSFHVSREKQLFHCFGCGASGNLIQFIMRTENLDFVDALKLLADKAGITLPENDTEYNDETHKKRIRILEMNKVAARFFYDSLMKSADGRIALKYLSERKITPKTINSYGIGYAPDSYDMLLNHLEDNGYSQEEIIDASLAVKRESRVYDKFRKRVMFPIINTRGDIIGFGGRIIDMTVKDGYKPPKYLNSGETTAFSKGKNLFSLNLAKNSAKSSIILCEGYMDVISVYQAGITNIVATLGTAITTDQARLLMRYANVILLCYDSDEAGQKATMRAIDIINSVNGSARVIKLRDAKDPDEYIKKNGVGLFSKAITDAIPANEYKLSLIRLKYDLTDTDNKVKYIQEATKSLCALSNPVEIDAYISNISAESGIRKEAIYADFKKASRMSRQKDAKELERTTRPIHISASQHTPVNVPANKITEAEKRILSIIARNKSLSAIVRDELSPEDFSSSVYGALADMIYKSWSEGKAPEISVLVNEFSNDIDKQNEAAAVFYNNEIYTADNAAIRELLDSVIMGKLNIELKNCTDAVQLQQLIKKQNEIKERQATDQ